MTTYPTILGTSGHKSGDPYAPNTYYTNIGLGRSVMLQYGIGTGITDETDAAHIIRVPGEISQLSWGVDEIEFGGPLYFRLRVNGSDPDPGLSVSFATDETGLKTDTSGVVAVASGDYIDFACDVALGAHGSVPGGAAFYCASARFDPPVSVPPISAQMIVAQGLVGGSALTPNSGPQFGKCFGILSFNTDVHQEQFDALTSGTWEYLACHIESSDFDHTVKVKSNTVGVGGNMVIPITGGTLGSTYLEDPSHIDSVVAGDLINYKVDSGSATSGRALVDWVGCHFLPSPATNCMIGGAPRNSTVIGSTTGRRWSALFGGGDPSNDLTRATGKFPYSGTASNFANYISWADSTGTATFTLRISGSFGSVLATSSTAGHSGWFIDTSSVAVTTAQTCANQIDWSAGSVTWDGAGLLLSS